MADSIPEPVPQGAAAIAGNAVGDQPTPDDSLGFTPYVEAIAAFLTSRATQPPLTMSIEGEWGSGKSSFMLQLERAIRGPSRRDVFIQQLPQSLGGLSANGSLWTATSSVWRHRPQLTMQFNAWRHDKQDALWAAFALKFGKSLRKQVGFFRGWKGDILLFFKRLTGLRGWLELLLVSASFLILAVATMGLYRYAKVHNATELTEVIANLTAPETSTPPQVEKPPTTSNRATARDPNGGLAEPYRLLLTHGKWGALLALGIAGFIRFHKQVKVPLSINLEKYLAKPDYQGRVAFIETFHEDFARLVEAYAKDRRVFVFIDDLDRCDVPRAAELMQAINLMIGDVGRLVFVLGMDREKVAAGVAQRYKDMLPFMPGFAPSGSGPDTGGLYFGYAYLEKFIQISFTLPVVSDRLVLNRFLANIGAEHAHFTWSRRLANYWTDRFKRLSAFWSTRPEPQVGSPAVVHEMPAPKGGTVSTSTDAVEQERRVRYLRVKVDKDSKRILDIVTMVSGIFQNNPRKLKQFMNTFRLALFLSSEQGLLDEEEGSQPVTPEQVGKFVALTLRFPDLRTHLSENPLLLSHLERRSLVAQELLESDVLYKWLHQRGVRDVLRYGIQEGARPFLPAIYSLETFPVDKLLSILPRVPERPIEIPPAAESVQSVKPESTPDVNDELEIRFRQLAEEYEEVRARGEFSASRTQGMIAVFSKGVQEAASLPPAVRPAAFSKLAAADTSGARIMALAIAGAYPDQADIGWLLKVLRDYRSWFEHHLCIAALLRYVELLSADDRRSIADSLNVRWKEIAADPDRLPLAEQLRAAIQRGAPNPVELASEPMVASDPAKATTLPSLFISYATQDQAFAEQLHSDLQAHGVRCWFAPRDVKSGRKLHEQIDEAIRLHDKLLLILSEQSMSSEWVKTEIVKARQRELKEGKRVLFPVRLASWEALRNWESFDAEAGKNLADEIREYFIPDFSNWKDHDSYQMALGRLLTDLKAEASR